MSSTKSYEWKILALGSDQQLGEEIKQHLHSLGYKNARVVLGGMGVRHRGGKALGRHVVSR
ncbi:unnamed protein product, partial [Didymodactylos carnosus]